MSVILAAHDFACNLAVECARYLHEQALARCKGGRALDVEIKESTVDLVTHADTQVERMVEEAIRKRWPDHELLGEEAHAASGSKTAQISSAPTWIVDPLDGTVNWAHLFPTFCISIALAIDRKPVVGVVVAPMLGGLNPLSTFSLFSACEGHGAWLTAVSPSDRYRLSGCPPTSQSTQLPYIRPPQPFPQDAPRGCVFVAEWGKQRRVEPGSHMDRKIQSFTKLMADPAFCDGLGGMCHGLRSLGSATLDMVLVATGGGDIFWEGGAWPWDVAAGMCILSEAGGVTFSANPPAEPSISPLPEADVAGRLYLALRPCAPDDSTTTSRQAQERVARAVWTRTEPLLYKSP